MCTFAYLASSRIFLASCSSLNSSQPKYVGRLKSTLLTYGGGSDKSVIENFANILGNYSGERTDLHKRFIDDEFYNSAKDVAMKYYLAFVDKDANNEPFVVPEYKF